MSARGRGLLLAIASQLMGAVGAAGQDAHAHEQCREEIRRLEDRLAQLERVVSQIAPGAALASSTALALGPQPQAQSLAPSPQPGRSIGYQPPPELIPEVGKIGAEVGLLMGGSWNPFKLNRGSFNGGFIDLPLFDKPDWIRGKIAYEISVALSQSRTTFETTSNVAQVSNLAVLTALNPNGGLDNVLQAVTGTGSAPFPVKTNSETRFRLLQVAPFSLKYTSTAFDRWRIRPYALLGFGIFVTIHNQNPARGTPASYGVRQDAAVPPAILAALNGLYGGQAPFGAPLVAGQISQSPEVVARGLPGGNGNFDLGLVSGAGVAVRLNRNFSLGLDARFNRIAGTNGGFKTLGSRIGFHF